MKKGLLLILSIALCLSTIAQVTENFPNGFRRAKVPASMKNSNLKVPYRLSEVDNGMPSANPSILRVASSQPPISPSDETLIGNTFYDLQTNNAISNRLILNDDGTISAAWTFSPNAIQTTTPPFPSRGSGYNYWNGSAWLYPAGPTARQEPVRTGFTNIVVTNCGGELLISHTAVGTTDSNQIAVASRPVKGTGAWTVSYPWGHAYDTWPKAVSARTNNNVYVVFQGSGASASTTAPPHVVAGQTGPIYFAKSTDCGVSWGPKMLIPQIDSTFYDGFGGDEYSIDAIGDTVAISFSGTYIDVGLLKSYDAGNTWEKTIIQRHPIPHYADCNCTTNFIHDATNDTIVDTVYSNAGDSKVLIDNDGMCHVWFADFPYSDDDSLDDLYSPQDYADNLFYWNETMGPDTSRGWFHSDRKYVSIASSQDFNGNGEIDTPEDTFTTCTARRPWGEYGGSLTQMPSAGIDANGKIYLTYQTLVEAPHGDTTNFHAVHRHVFMMTLAKNGGTYNANEWTYPYCLVPDIASGGYGEQQEGVFAAMARKVDANYAYVLYQRDDAPGHGLAADLSCDKEKNLGNSSDIILVKADVTTVGIATLNSSNLFVSQNYPNPSLGSTYINLGLKKSASVKIVVNDIIGKVVYSETIGNLTTGPQTIHLNTSNWESGVYTYTVMAGGEKTTRRMIVQ